MITQKIKTAFKKLHGISLEKYYVVIEKKAEERRKIQMRKIEQQIEQNLSKW